MLAAADLIRANARKPDPEMMEKAAQLKAAAQMAEDALFVIQKNRETGEECWRRLWFDKGGEGSWQYFDEDTREQGAHVYWEDLG